MFEFGSSELCVSGLSPPKPPCGDRTAKILRDRQDNKWRYYPTTKTIAELNNCMYYDANITSRILVNVIHTVAGHIDDPE